MNTSQLTILRNELQDSLYIGASYEEIAALLNNQTVTTIPNTESQPSIPRPVTMMDVLEAAFINDTVNTPTLVSQVAPIADRFERDLTERNERAIQFYLALYGAALNTQAQLAIQSLFEQTDPDPSWSSTVTLTEPSRATVLGLPIIRTEDIQSALYLQDEVIE